METDDFVQNPVLREVQTRLDTVRSAYCHSCSHATGDRECNIGPARQVSFLGSEEAQGELEQLDSSMEWPVASTFGNILQRAGLTSPERKKRRTTPYSEPFSEVTAPN